MIDACRNMVLVSPSSNKKWHRARRHIFCRESREQPLHLHFRLTVRQIEIVIKPFSFRDVGEKRVDIFDADARQHIGTVLGV
jgi:hypothetical protein